MYVPNWNVRYVVVRLFNKSKELFGDILFIDCQPLVVSAIG